MHISPNMLVFLWWRPCCSTCLCSGIAQFIFTRIRLKQLLVCSFVYVTRRKMH